MIFRRPIYHLMSFISDAVSYIYIYIYIYIERERESVSSMIFRRPIYHLMAFTSDAVLYIYIYIHLHGLWYRHIVPLKINYSSLGDLVTKHIGFMTFSSRYLTHLTLIFDSIFHNGVSHYMLYMYHFYKSYQMKMVSRHLRYKLLFILIFILSACKSTMESFLTKMADVSLHHLVPMTC